jgi:hypothetical protein
VTRNSRDFRGSSSDPGRKGQYKDTDLHAGLVCINGPNRMDITMQVKAFAAVLDALSMDSAEPDLTNQVLEATIESEAAPQIIILRRYDLPSTKEASPRDAAAPRRKRSHMVVDGFANRWGAFSKAAARMMFGPGWRTPHPSTCPP